MADAEGLRGESSIEALIDVSRQPVASVLESLLADKSVPAERKGHDRHIVWATDSYASLGEGFAEADPIGACSLLRHADVIRPRFMKSREAQSVRTRKKAEVTTSTRLCRMMNDVCDEDWFGRPAVFSVRRGDGAWDAAEGTIVFPKGRTWRQYVDSRRLEITCGEAPYLASRYDAATGERIPPDRRIGVLDRKLRVVDENAAGREEWTKWAIRALEATYGYEFQGDSLLIARVNLLMTFAERHEARWGAPPDAPLLRKAANRIAWNVWQMDGLADLPPFARPEAGAPVQLELFAQTQEPGDVAVAALYKMAENAKGETPASPCRIYDWRARKPVDFRKMKEANAMKGKLFDYVVGNPPYNEDFENSGENGNFAKPVYHRFMSESYKVAEKVELVHPARFLFNAGSTPKPWNEQMLKDPHFKVLRYEANSTALFPDVDIKGGVAVTYRDATRDFGAIGTFVVFPELASIKRKAGAESANSFSRLVYAPESYRFTEKMHEDNPTAAPLLSKGHRYDFKSNVLEKLDTIAFFAPLPPPENDYKYVRILGLVRGKRVERWIRRDYIEAADNFEKFKVFVPEANGTGAIGEVLSTPLIGQPLIGHTQTFISIGSFGTESEANACMKYVKTKFARTLLGVKKVTQHNPRGTWGYVPLQDFTKKSDIDWTKSVREIDRQLYGKYGLDESEIAFIESHVKEMA